jgi:hypothetical protein
MRSLFHRSRPRHGVCLLGAFLVASGCVASGSNNGEGATQVADAGIGGGRNFMFFDGGRVDAQVARDGGFGLDKRCGTTDFCIQGTPDQPSACAGYPADAGAAGPVRRHDAGTRHVVDASVGSPDAAAVPEGGADAGDASSSKEHEGGVRARSLPVPAPVPAPDGGGRYSCQVTRDNSGAPVHQCEPSGMRDNGMPCNFASDCAPGYACVGTTHPGATSSGVIGQCLHYCCDPSTCKDPGTYCAERPLFEDSNGDKPLVVPVCAPGDACALLEPFPCTNTNCTCPQDTSCTVVRSDGTLGCVTPGTGKVNDRCGRPDSACSAGYYCSLATSLCVKMCKTDGLDSRCAPGKCQAAAGFPTGFGLCVGYTPATQ